MAPTKTQTASWWPRRLKMRFVICVLTTLCPTVCYVSRLNLSLAIVAMVKDPSLVIATPKISTNSSAPPADPTLSLPTPPMPETFGPKYDWSQAEVGLLNGAFFWTYVVFQIPLARVAERVGAKWVLAIATIGSSLLSLLSPLAASAHVYAFVCLRLAMGACQTALYPAAYILYCKWLPPAERSLALPILYAAAYVGSIISSIATGYLCEVESLGWEYAFYLPGVVCALWSLIWILVASSVPRDNSFISASELSFIESNLERQQQQACNKTRQEQRKQPDKHQLLESTKLVDGDRKSTIVSSDIGDQYQNQRQLQPPELSWRKVLCAESVWALIYAFVASNWSFSIILLILPSYLNNVIGVSTLKNGMINASIYGLYCICCPIVGAVSTMMVEARSFGLSRLQVRKIFQSIALFGQTACYLLLPHIEKVEFVLLLLLAQIVLFSLVNGGEVQMPSELSVDFSGTIYALCNSVGSATGFILPAMQSLMVENPRSRSQYASFFYLSAAIIANNAFVFLIFGRGDYQDLANHNGDRSTFCSSADSTTNSNLRPLPDDLTTGNYLTFDKQQNVLKLAPSLFRQTTPGQNYGTNCDKTGTKNNRTQTVTKIDMLSSI